MKDKFDIDFDVRVVDRNIRDNKITRKDYEKQLDALDDISELAEPLIIEDDTEQVQDEGHVLDNEAAAEQANDVEGEE
ncbi:MAG: hypothetical protein GWO07_05450 [Candidatus Dadabacteria bacterium]|nr:hypothetical protein [Candidatus Dadabacteria bacterium]NIS08203.1 hypothetical protein [Candidatus Dadabacteria bacterium]NIV41449.1 hypothetical protein [Candidatus Dadabacteria bacterium]NIY21693.1 hypothetical protein [Candidatus Dadabacteria bacterium]